MEKVCKLYSDLKIQSKKIKEIKERLIEFLHTVPSKSITIGPYDMRIKQKKKQKGWNKELILQCMMAAFEDELTPEEIASKVDLMCTAKNEKMAGLEEHVEDLEFKERS